MSDGCYVRPHCLTCDLPACVFDMKQHQGLAMVRTVEAQSILRAYLALVKQGATSADAVTILATENGVSPKTIYHRLRRINGGKHLLYCEESSCRNAVWSLTNCGLCLLLVCADCWKNHHQNHNQGE